MSMSMHAVAIIPADEKYKKMLKVYEACEEAGIDLPEDVADFFDGEEPDANGLTIQIGSQYRDNHPSTRPYKADMVDGFEITIADLPPHTERVRVYCSY